MAVEGRKVALDKVFVSELTFKLVALINFANFPLRVNSLHQSVHARFVEYDKG